MAALDPDLVALPFHHLAYYQPLIEHLVRHEAYVPDESLFGFPYDFRQSVRHAATLDALTAALQYASRRAHRHRRRHRTSSSSSSSSTITTSSSSSPSHQNDDDDDEGVVKVDVVSHSMGGLVFKALLVHRPAVVEKYVRKWVTIATPFGGAPVRDIYISYIIPLDL